VAPLSPAADPIQAKAREFFAQRVEERKGTSSASSRSSTGRSARAVDDWIKTADELKKLQAEWQAIGPVPRQDTRATLETVPRRVRRILHAAQRGPRGAEGSLVGQPQARRKRCAPARRSWPIDRMGQSAAEIRRLQAEWKTVGPVRRNKSEALWQRFRAACDTSSIATSGATRSI
jgi:hypothetical protein